MAKYFNKKKYDEFIDKHRFEPDWILKEFWGIQMPAHDAHHILGRSWRSEKHSYGKKPIIVEPEDFLIPLSRRTHNLMKQHRKEFEVLCLRILCKRYPEKKKLLHVLNDGKWRDIVK